MDVVPSPPLPPPPPRRPTIRAIAAGVIVVGAIALSLVAVGGRNHSSATPSGAHSPSPGPSSLPSALGGQPRITSGEVLRRIRGEAPRLPVAGVSYDLALYGQDGHPTSMLMVIRGLGHAVDALPRDVFFQTVGNGLATGMARSGMKGRTVAFAHGVQASARGADHDCVPLRNDGRAQGVICVFRTSGTIGMVVLFHGTDPRAALTLSERAAAAIT